MPSPQTLLLSLFLSSLSSPSSLLILSLVLENQSFFPYGFDSQTMTSIYLNRSSLHPLHIYAIKNQIWTFLFSGRFLTHFRSWESNPFCIWFWLSNYDFHILKSKPSSSSTQPWYHKSISSSETSGSGLGNPRVGSGGAPARRSCSCAAMGCFVRGFAAFCDDLLLWCYVLMPCFVLMRIHGWVLC